MPNYIFQFFQAMASAAHPACILETRKTAPGLRLVDKWAVPILLLVHDGIFFRQRAMFLVLNPWAGWLFAGADRRGKESPDGPVWHGDDKR